MKNRKRSKLLINANKAKAGELTRETSGSRITYPIHAREVQAGAEGKAPGRDYEVVIDRRAAIRRAIEIARRGDCVLLAGKGHERSMQMAGGSEPWDERAEVEAAIKEKRGLPA